jgi:hypothetical protein
MGELFSLFPLNTHAILWKRDIKNQTKTDNHYQGSTVMAFKINADELCTDHNRIIERLKSPLSRFEFFSLALLVCLILIFAYHHQIGFYQPVDFFYSFIPAGGGDYSNFFYSYWIMPVLFILEKVPFSIAYIIWALINVGSTWFAGRVFGGRRGFSVLNYQLLFVLSYGQITGIILGGLALAWWGLASKKFHIAGLGFLIAAIKPQLGAMIGIIMLLLSDTHWNERLKTLVVPLFGFLVTTVIYPHWIQNILIALDNGLVNFTGNLSLWKYLGVWSLTLLIPPLLIKTSREKRFLFLIVAAMLSLPYLQQTGLLALYVFPFGWLALLGNLGFLVPLLGWEYLQLLAIVPMIIYMVFLVQGIRASFGRNNSPEK